MATDRNFLSKSKFAASQGWSPSYITKLKKQSRLVYSPDKKLIDVDATLLALRRNDTAEEELDLKIAPDCSRCRVRHRPGTLSDLVPFRHLQPGVSPEFAALHAASELRLTHAVDVFVLLSKLRRVAEADLAYVTDRGAQ